MDIRIATYQPVTVTTATQPGSPLAVATVQNAAQSGPVQAINKIAQAPDNGGYTDSIRGSLVNILA